ncbi:carbohydrate ABC transporter permease [Paenibacillus sp. PL2-23]|uniref:carbohydrate ABC transporter permease n=1 Tax=Paenibacillus sp. PL2-23 TaxID=2100729 RepID=UPI0030FD11F6
MGLNNTTGRSVFNVINYGILSAAALMCLVPFIHLLAISFSNTAAIQGGLVGFLPVNFTLEPYKYVIGKDAFWASFLMTVMRVLIGLVINLILVVLTAYPLSKSNERFRKRTKYVWIFFFTMLFSGGLIPNYLLVKELHLMNTIWALVLPSAVMVFNIVLMLNFFREVPEEMEDAAYIDGAGHWRILFQIYIPVSLPAVATIAMFSIVFHWNNWFDGLIYMKVDNYPLQTYLQSIIINFNSMTMSTTDAMMMAKLNDRSIKASQLIVGAIPILMVYPFLQKYFVAGIKVGGVKG